MEENKEEMREYDILEFQNDEIWKALKVEIAAQYTPDDKEEDEVNGKNC